MTRTANGWNITMLNDDERLPEGWAMIRCEHPEPIIYTFGSDIDPITWKTKSSFRFFVTVKQFNKEYGLYEANRRHVIQRCAALDFAADMTEPFRVVKDALGANNLMINGETLLRIIMFHSMRDNNPGGAFKAREFKLLFEPYTNAKNEALDWFETVTPRDRAAAFLSILNDAIRLAQTYRLKDGPPYQHVRT